MPPVLWALIAVEGLWAFAFFAVQATLTLSMTGETSRIFVGIGWLRLGATAAAAHAFASLTYGVFSAAAYGLPLLGGLIAERSRAGRRGTALTGLGVLVLGDGLILWPGAFLIGLAAIAVGTGLLKSNLLAQIGLVAAEVGVPRPQAFGAYLIAANVGALSAPLLSGTLGEQFGWTAAYAVAGVAAGAAFGLYACICPKLPPTRLRRDPSPSPRFNYRSLAGPLLAEIIFFAAYNTSFTAFPVWARAYLDRRIFGFQMPVTWFGTLDGVLTVLATGLAIRLWRRRLPSAGARIAIGASLAVLAFLVLALASANDRPSLALAASYFALVDAGLPWVDATVLARLSVSAAPGTESRVSGVYFAASAAASLITGALGALYGPLGPANFWLLQALLCCAVVGIALQSTRRIRS